MDENDAMLPPVRLPKTLLNQAKAQASRRDETMSQVIRRALRAYIALAPVQTDIEDVIKSSKRQKVINISTG